MLSALCRQNKCNQTPLAQPKTFQQEFSKFSVATPTQEMFKDVSCTPCEKQRTHKGAVCLDCVSMKTPEELIDEIRKSLRKEKVKCVKDGKHLIYCQKFSVKFEIEIMALEQLKEGNYIRTRKLAGESKEYRKVMRKVLANVKL